MKKAIKSRFPGGDSPTEEAKDAVKDARSTARSAVGAVRKAARRQFLRGRIAAARATAPRRTRTSKKSVAAAGAAGAAGVYFLDPQDGARRRHQVRDRALALFRKGSERVRGEAEHRRTQAEDKVEALKSKARPEKPAANDQALAERVKSEIFQPADAPKGSVSVNVERGIVYLRGEVPKRRDAEKLVKQATSVDGVNGVQSLLSSG